MKSNWKKFLIADLCSNVTSGGTPKSTNSEYYDGGTIPWLNTKEVKFNRIYNTEKCITELGLKNSSAKWIKQNNVIIAMYGATAGNVAINKIPLTTNQACCNLEINENIADYKYIYYYLLNNYNVLSSMANGGAQQNLNSLQIKNFEILLPSLNEQRQIASILSIIDDKIELNNSLNNNLEQQAQAIFNNKFVNIESIPNNWETSNLSTIADYLNGLAMQKFRPNNDEIGIPVLKIKELRQGFCDNQSDLCSPNIKSEYLINDGDVIFSWSGTLWLDLWCSGLCGLNQHLFKVTSSKYDKWFYYFWTKYHLNKFIAIAADKATTMGHIKREDLDKSEVLIPDDETYTQLTSLLSPILELIIKNKVENRQLIQLRDTLLPKLMSGEIDVTNVDISTDKLSFSEK